MQADVQELKLVADQFSAKYGKPYAQVFGGAEIFLLWILIVNRRKRGLHGFKLTYFLTAYVHLLQNGFTMYVVR